MEVELNNSAVVSPSSQPLDLNSIRSRIGELRDISSKFEEVAQLNSSEVDEFLKDCALQLECKIDQILSDASDISSLSLKDLEEFLDHLERELRSVEEENAKAEEKLEELLRRYLEDSTKLESELEGLSCSLEVHELKGIEKGNWPLSVSHHSSSTDGDEADMSNPSEGSKFKILELDHLIEKNKDTLKALQDLDCKFRRLEAIETIEDSFSCLQVVECEGNSIRLSVRTSIPNMESIFSMQKMENLIERPSEQSHELLLELADGTMELKKVEIFPNDVYIGEIIDATKSFRQLYASLPGLENRSSLEWLVRRVQDRIVLSTMRRSVVKCANKSRYSFEYSDRDQIIIAHMVGGIDAVIKVAQGWPISDASLDLITLKSPNNSLKEISLIFLCKVVELANSLDVHIRRSISSFVDGIEEILLQQSRAEVQPDHIARS